MYIYFINRKSNLVGPYDITDSHRKKIITVGDVIIRDTANGALFLLVVSEINKWNSCKCVAKAEECIGFDSNSLLFFFDGVTQRFGNISNINKIKKFFQVSTINIFFDNALSILEYRSDMWDVNIFYQMHQLSPVELQKTHKKTTTEHFICRNNSAYLFEHYLDPDELQLFKTLIEQDRSLREAYSEIRRQYPEKFRKSLKSFLNDNPQSTIYDKEY